MTDAFERFSHRARPTKRGKRSEVRPSAAPRSGSRNHAECARARGRGERPSFSEEVPHPCGVIRERPTSFGEGLQDFSADRGFRLAPLSFSRNVARPGALTYPSLFLKILRKGTVFA